MRQESIQTLGVQGGGGDGTPIYWYASCVTEQGACFMKKSSVQGLILLFRYQISLHQGMYSLSNTPDSGLDIMMSAYVFKVLFSIVLTRKKKHRNKKKPSPISSKILNGPCALGNFFSIFSMNYAILSTNWSENGLKTVS